ncbi:hypothetical protein EV651_113168 [Kribbella sp. VKM Ac-2571]|nr:hypothetical protein EV651_113168 [Kribbella sp. VKM Ac-2571]
MRAAIHTLIQPRTSASSGGIGSRAVDQPWTGLGRVGPGWTGLDRVGPGARRGSFRSDRVGVRLVFVAGSGGIDVGDVLFGPESYGAEWDEE